MRELGQPYADFLRRVRSEGGNLPAFDGRPSVSITRFERRLLDHWGLPQSIVRAIALPHDCELLLKLPQEECLLPQVLHVAELMAELLAEGRAAILPELLQVAACYRHVSNEQLQSLAVAVDEKVRQLTESLSVKSHSPIANPCSSAPMRGWPSPRQAWLRSLPRRRGNPAALARDPVPLAERGGIRDGERTKTSGPGSHRRRKHAAGESPGAARRPCPPDGYRKALNHRFDQRDPADSGRCVRVPFASPHRAGGKNDPALLDRLAGSSRPSGGGGLR